jgi:hypothetical protein
VLEPSFLLTIVLAPLGARGADLVVWWDKAVYPKEEEALHDTVVAFEQETGKQVDIAFYPQEKRARWPDSIKPSRDSRLQFSKVAQTRVKSDG